MSNWCRLQRCRIPKAVLSSVVKAVLSSMVKAVLSSVEYTGKLSSGAHGGDGGVVIMHEQVYSM